MVLRHIRWIALLAFAAHGEAASLAPGWNTVALRGVDQDVMYVPAQPSQGPNPVVLFMPGDAGWRGFAVEVTDHMAAAGYSVFGLDTKRYLSSFTNGKTTLTTRQMSGDLHRLLRWIAPDGKQVLVVGWSQGAAMAVLAAQGRRGHQQVSGVVTISLPEEAALGWSRMDTLMSLFRKRPNQPHFAVKAHIGSVRPVGLYMIHPGNDSFTTPDREQELFRVAKEPKELVVIPDAGHSFDEARESFWTALGKGLEWAGQAVHP